MKKLLTTLTLLLLCFALLAGCRATTTDPSTEPTTEPTTTEPTTAASEEVTEEVTEDSELAYYINGIYAEAISRYYTALSEQWNEDAYFENEMSPLAAYYYDGNPLDNIGFTFIDIDGDGNKELFIGAIDNAENDPLVLEIWTIIDDQPVMLGQSGTHNRYYLQYEAEVYNWSIAYEAENGAANWLTCYLQILDHELTVTQGIVFDAIADEANPWFLTYDLDWDTTNDEPTDEDMANAILTNGRNIYAAAEYIPYSSLN